MTDENQSGAVVSDTCRYAQKYSDRSIQIEVFRWIYSEIGSTSAQMYLENFIQKEN